MWRRLGEVCEALLVADDTQARELWSELNGPFWSRVQESALDGDPEVLAVLVRCHELLKTSEVREQCKRISPRRADEWKPDADDAAARVAQTVAALLAIRCAGGEERLLELIEWLSRAGGGAIVPGISRVRPAVATSPFAWIRAASAHLKPDPINRDDRIGTLALLTIRERNLILHSLSNSKERASIEPLLSRCRPSLGLHFEELRDWPRDGAAGAFPAANALGDYQPEQRPNDFPTFIRLLGSEDRRVLLPAVSMFERIVALEVDPDSRRESVPHLFPLLRDDHPAVRGLILRALSRLAIEPDHVTEVTRHLGRLLRDPVPAVRVEAALAALRLQRVTRSVVRGLTAQLADDALDVRRESANAVSGLGSRLGTRTVLSRLVALLHEEDVGVVTQAARAARALAGRMTRSLRDALIRCLANGDATVRTESLRALAEGGRRISSRRTIQAVSLRAGDATAVVRREMLLALGQLLRDTDDPPTEQIAALLADADGLVQLAAVTLAQRLGKRLVCASIVNRLSDLLGFDKINPTGIGEFPFSREHFSPSSVVVLAVQAMELMGPIARTPAVVGRLIELLFSGKREVAEQACRSLGRLGEEVVLRVTTHLVQLLRSPDQKTRSRCLGALMQIRELACWSPFLRALTLLLDEPQAELRTAGAAALEWLGPEAATDDILARLEELRADPDSDVRLYVAYARARLRPPG